MSAFPTARPACTADVKRALQEADFAQCTVLNAKIHRLADIVCNNIYMKNHSMSVKLPVRNFLFFAAVLLSAVRLFCEDYLSNSAYIAQSGFGATAESARQNALSA